jgi:DNA-binding PadR family transcriptional regulator
MIPDTRYAILGLLARRPSHGYELATRFNEMFGPGRRISPGQIYEILQKLRGTGWAEYMPGPHQGKRELKVHRITDAGEQALTEWHAGPCAAQAPRDTLYLKLALARPQDAPHLLRAIALQEQTCVDLLRRYTENENASLAPKETDEWETLTHETIDEAASIRLHGELDWLSKTRKRIERFLERLQNLAGMAGDQSLIRPNDTAAA